jgi:hypothetical protein
VMNEISALFIFTVLIDRNIESNLFSGPVPVKLLNLPNFK